MPYLGRALSYMLMMGDMKLAQEFQDVPVFGSQRPHKPSLDCNYKLIVADRGVYYYLSERERRIAAARNKKALPVLHENGASAADAED